MSEERDGFLNRWSRLKRAAVEPAKPAAPEAIDETKPSESEEVPFDHARLEIPLPSLDELKPGDTLVAFMQKGVPEVLRNAALRKMWAIDPMVRDFKSEALDYAWDWNTPGGVPGGGPLGPADQVQEMVEALFRPSAPPEDPPAQPESLQSAAIQREDEPPAEEETGSIDEPETAEPPQSELKTTETVPKKRHGGALPQV